MTEKLVLDACCGSKMFWFDKDDIAFIKKQMESLNEQKAMLTERIKTLLDLT